MENSFQEYKKGIPGEDKGGYRTNEKILEIFG